MVHHFFHLFRTSIISCCKNYHILVKLPMHGCSKADILRIFYPQPGCFWARGRDRSYYCSVQSTFSRQSEVSPTVHILQTNEKTEFFGYAMTIHQVHSDMVRCNRRWSGLSVCNPKKVRSSNPSFVNHFVGRRQRVAVRLFTVYDLSISYVFLCHSKFQVHGFQSSVRLMLSPSGYGAYPFHYLND